MQTRHRNTFITIKTEGAILPPDLLQRISGTDDSLDGLQVADYHLLKNEKLNEAINRSWNRLIGAWESFQTARKKIAEGQPGTTVTRERWLLPLFQELDYGRLQTSTAFSIDGKTYPISHIWGKAPVHLLGFNVELDKRTARVAGAAKTSPHSMVQEFLNRSDDHLWAFLSNGLQLRILRDNVSLTRQAYVEFDLQGMMDGEVYADFVLLWLLCHQSRVEGEKPEEFWLEKWSREAHEQGTRALDQLRSGVEDAISHLGSGFLTHPANHALRDSLRVGSLSTQDYYRQLLRLVYRLIFLFVAEDRELLFSPDSDQLARQRYSDYYSTRRLRRLAERSRGFRHSDLYHTLRLLTEKLGSLHGCAELALPALGSFLFSEISTHDLNQADLPNRYLLDAVRSLAYTVDKRTLRPVDYKNLGPEELGSVYESLLELHPELNVDAGTFSLTSASGHERKTTGSYYTPASLIRVLLDSALDPVIEDRLNAVKNEPLEAQEAALLDIKVCDPASGSGHFLIAAAHRLAKRLAALRTGTDEPPPEATRTALRDVIGHCIYGVDINPMAVELCKVSLWMEALEPGKPLSFLDAHIKCGNSLVGVGPGMEIEEIPDDAFRPAFGDDKATATALRRRNKREREGQLGFRWDVTLIKDHEDLTRWIKSQAVQLEAMPEEEIRQVHAKAEAYNTSLESEEYIQGRLEYDLWTASFFWPIPKGDAENMLAPTQQELIRLRKGDDLDAELVHRITDISRKQNFFHWSFEFPSLFSDDHYGFDVMLGNPPWERIKLQEQEFFARRDPEIAGAPNKAARERMIRKLPHSHPQLASDFERAKHTAESTSIFVRNSSRFPFTAVGDVNTYALFAELFRSFLSSAGRAGIIVPTGISTDSTMQVFFGDLVDQQAVVSLFDFENREKIFPAVDSRYKFCLLTLSQKPVGRSEFTYFATNVAHLKDDMRRFHLSPEDIALFNPNTRTMPVFRTESDANLVLKLYNNFPILHNELTGENPWGTRFMTMFHKSNDSGLFRTENDLIKLGYIKKDNQYVKDDNNYIPLYEGRMVNIFDHRYAIYDSQNGEYSLPSDRFSINISTEYWVPNDEVKSRLERRNCNSNWLFGIRRITNNTNERTVVGSIIPRIGVTYGLYLILTKYEFSKYDALLLGNLLSIPFDYICRNSFSQPSLTYGVLKQLPVLQPIIYSISDKEFILSRILELVYTTWDLKPFAQDVGYEGPPFQWDEERRALLRAELDAYYARLYGLNRKQLRYILDPADLTPIELKDILDYYEEVEDPLDADKYATRCEASKFPGETFRVLKQKEIKKFGEYRTRRLVLQAWDHMQEVIDNGMEYVPMVDPPPAHPSVAHPMRDGSVYEGPGFVTSSEPIDQQKSQTRQVLKEEQPTAIKETFASKPTKDGSLPIVNSTQTSDYNLYKCEICGQMVMGFDQVNHTQQMHGGEDPGYVKL